MEKQKDAIDYELIKKQALEQFRSGKSLTGKEVLLHLYSNNF
jgi:hypothetical protein